ncbi:putative alpha/beta hydrolase [Oxalobacteraceae bacterium GrIS 2.11]
MKIETGLSNVEPELVEIVCADGVDLSGHFIRAGAVAGGLPVLICPATGVRQQFYLRFAKWLSEQGHDVLVFDYRGIGLSLRGKLKHSKATLADWGQKDQVAALEWMLQRTGCNQVVLLGHSAGGQMIGLMPNHNYIARVVGVATSTGWFAVMRPLFRLKARFGLRWAIPLAIRFIGYAPTSKFGLGEDLPAEVARQWGQWCAAGGYATNATRGQPELDFHAEIRIPFSAFYASDDDIATSATVDDLMRTFPNAIRQKIQIEPDQLSLKSLGHMDWFRHSHRAVWPLLANAIRGNTQN